MTESGPISERIARWRSVSFLRALAECYRSRTRIRFSGEILTLPTTGRRARKLLKWQALSETWPRRDRLRIRLLAKLLEEGGARTGDDMYSFLQYELQCLRAVLIFLENQRDR